MARKVFISFLGTSNYVQTSYNVKGEISKPVRFVQEALLDYLCKDWGEEDKIFIFYTEDSYKMNWVDNGQKFIKSEIETIGLEHILKEKTYANLVESTKIDEGFSTEGVWTIFNTVYNKLKDGDEIYLDVTHAFRSIPMFSTVLFNFSRLMKNTSLVSVQYGAFEKLGFASEVNKMPLSERIAPVVEMQEFLLLNQYTDCVSELVKFGRMGSISGMLIGDEETSNRIKDLSTSINALDGAISTVRTDEIQKGNLIKQIRDNCKNIRKEKLPEAVYKVLTKLIEELTDFVPQNSYQNIEAAIKWAFKYGMYPQAYTLAQEYIITLVVDALIEKNPYTHKSNNKNKSCFRDYISSILGLDLDTPKDKLKGELENFPDLALEIVNMEFNQAMHEKYDKLRGHRNTLNHANAGKDSSVFKKDFEDLFYTCLNIVKDASKYIKSSVSEVE